MTVGDPVISPATLRQVNGLRHAGLLPARQFLAAATLVRDHKFWRRWAERALLALGSAHLLAAVIYFFAYNWADLPSLAKFAIVETAIVAAVVAAALAKLDRPWGQAMLIAASVLVGVLLAVIGQVYQTGADAYELFIAWACLILPWVAVSRSAAHWLLWLAVGSLSLWAYGVQALVPDGVMPQPMVDISIGLLLGVALSAREFAAKAGIAWLAMGWVRLPILISALGLLFWPGIEFLLQWHEHAATVLVSIAAIAAAGIAYWRVLPDAAAATMVIGYGALFVIALGARVIDEIQGFGDIGSGQSLGSIGLLILWSVLATGGAAKLMQLAHRRIKRQAA